MHCRDDSSKSNTLRVDPPILEARSRIPKEKGVRSTTGGSQAGGSRLSRGGLRRFYSECAKHGHSKIGCIERANTNIVEV